MSFSERNKPCLHSAVCSTSIHVVMWYNFLFPFFFLAILYDPDFHKNEFHIVSSMTFPTLATSLDTLVTVRLQYCF